MYQKQNNTDTSMHSYIIWLSPYNNVEDQVRSKPITHSLFDGTVHQVTSFNCFQVTHHPQWHRTHRVFIWKQSTPIVNSDSLSENNPVILNAQTLHPKQFTIILNARTLHPKKKMHRLFIWKQPSDTECTDSSSETIYSDTECSYSSSEKCTLFIWKQPSGTECTLFTRKQSAVILNAQTLHLNSDNERRDSV